MRNPNQLRVQAAWITLTVFALTIAGCGHINFGHLESVSGSGTAKSETRSLTGFQSVELDIPATLIVTQSPEYSFKIETDDNLLPLILTEVKGNELTIHSDKGLSPSQKITITVSAPEYKELAIAGSAIITGGPLRSNELKLSIAGAGEIAFDVTAEKLTSDIAGSGAIKLGGNANKHIIDIAGSGSIEASKLLTETSEVDISGSGKATVHVAKSLKADISGSGNVYYSGDATDIKTSTSGSGRVEKVN